MIKKIIFYFEISKEANCAADFNGNPSKCQLKMEINLKHGITMKQIEKKKERMKEDVKKCAGEILQISESFLTMVEEPEYE